MKMDLGSSASGCVFDHGGRVPPDVHTPANFSSPLEEAVYNNDVVSFCNLIKEGAEVSVRLSVGQMSCLEYAAMMGHSEVLQALLDYSINANVLQKYFALDDVVERAYMISKNKNAFFEDRALAEANRYVAAVFTAILYNQPGCLQLLLERLGRWTPTAHKFIMPSGCSDRLNPVQLAQAYKHQECLDVLQAWRNS